MWIRTTLPDRSKGFIFMDHELRGFVSWSWPTIHEEGDTPIFYNNHWWDALCMAYGRHLYTTNNTASSSATMVWIWVYTSLLTGHIKDVLPQTEIQPAASTRPTSDDGARLIQIQRCVAWQGLTQLQYHHVENSTKKTKGTANLENGEGQWRLPIHGTIYFFV